MTADHEYAVLSLRRRLGACLSWAEAHEKDAARLTADAAKATASAVDARAEAEALKISIAALGGEPVPTDLEAA